MVRVSEELFPSTAEDEIEEALFQDQVMHCEYLCADSLGGEAYVCIPVGDDGVPF